MTRYKNLGGNSGVHAYEINHNSIAVEFKDATVYLYNTSSTSSYNISQMQKFAIAGKGLNSFINTTVKNAYTSKLK